MDVTCKYAGRRAVVESAHSEDTLTLCLRDLKYARDEDCASCDKKEEADA